MCRTEFFDLRHVGRTGDEVVVWHNFPKTLLGTDGAVGVPYLYPITILFENFFGFYQDRAVCSSSQQSADWYTCTPVKLSRRGIFQVDDEIGRQAP